ncbi:hypothetical protein L7F22_045472 [Adiantum nelumboides]|nr:hypothetical protein [Adiantum nelumboides]
MSDRHVERSCSRDAQQCESSTRQMVVTDDSVIQTFLDMLDREHVDASSLDGQEMHVADTHCQSEMPIASIASAFCGLMYEMLISRPNIVATVGAFAVDVVSRLVTDAGIVHGGAMKILCSHLHEVGGATPFSVQNQHSREEAIGDDGHALHRKKSFMSRSVEKYASLLRHCTSSKSLSAGQLLHDSIVRDFPLPPPLLFNLLIHMYGSCGALPESRSTFDLMPHRNIFSWNLIMAAYLSNGHASSALSLFRSLHLQGSCSPDSVTFVSALSACSLELCFSEGLWLHQLILLFAFECHVVVATALLTMYGKCGRIEHALWTFQNMPERNCFSWNAMLAAWVQQGDIKDSNQLFLQMMQEGLIGDRITCISLISLYTNHGSLVEGKRLHASIMSGSCEIDTALQNALISFYAAAQAEKTSEAKAYFARMQLEGVLPDEVTFSSMFSAFSNEFVVCEAKFLHALTAGCVHESDVVAQTALITMYGNCGRIEDARTMFDRMNDRDVAVWNAIITAYSQQGNVEASISLFCEMLAEGQIPNKVTFVTLIPVCADEAVLTQGSWIHEHVVSSNLKLDIEIGNSLVNMYGRCGSLEDALEVFSRMPEHNVVSWSSLLMLYTQHDFTEEALQLFEQMLTAGVTPDKVVFLCILPVCASEAALAQGRKVHHCIVSRDFDTDTSSITALLNMYSKCGSIEDTQRMFHLCADRSLVLWNSLIAAHAHHGSAKRATLCFNDMIDGGLTPDGCTFYSVLSACSHAGVLEEGLCYFISMVQQFFIVPTVEHFNCMVDMFGRAGQIESLEFVLKSMGLQPSGASWLTMLGACRLHSDRKRGEDAATQAFDVNPEDATPLVLLSNICRALES